MKFEIIYIDPPWGCYRDKNSNGKRGAVFKYPLMALNDIKSLPINKIAADNCILFIWATFPLLQEALDTIKAYGFTYKTIGFNFVKMNKKSINTLFTGLGHYTRSNAEICLIATKGKPKRVSKSVHSVIMSPIGRHSEKPAEARKRIVELMGELPRIEIFARDKAPGWHAVGNDIDGLDIREALDNIINC